MITSAMFVPGNQEKMLKKSLTINADVLVPDCEDSVPNTHKNVARDLISSFLLNNDSILSEKLVFPRLNGLNTIYFPDDFKTILTLKTSSIISGFTVPKIETVDDIHRLENLLSDKEKEYKLPKNKLKLIIWIESTLGIINMKEIYLKGKNRIVASAFGLEDYCHNLGLPRTKEMKELEIVRNLHAITSHAFDITALDGSYVEYTNNQGLMNEIEYVKLLGYKGKFAIHPSQVDIINKGFQPSQEEITEAEKIIKLYEEGISQGKGAIGIDNSMVDAPVYRRALDLLKKK